MANVTLRAIEVAKTISGNSPQTLSFPEGASQTFKRGAFVQLDATGRVIVIASATPAAILGVASMDATGTAGSDIIVWIANDDTVFVANLTTAGVALATQWPDVSRTYGIINVGNNWHIDKAGTRRVLILDLDRRDNLPATTGGSALGDVGGREHFMVLGNFAQLAATS